MRILMIGDIVGGPGRLAVTRVVGRLRQAGEVDFVVANGENAAGGNGITAALAEQLFAAGVDVITTGDHVWDQKETAVYIAREPRLLRPANFPPACPGRGWITVNAPKARVTVINLVGRTFMPPADCPFRAADDILRRGAELGPVVLVDMHAEATSEKIAMGHYLDGRASVVAGTHTHVQTSDETILPGGTAYITDLGMTGPRNSALGRDLEPVTRRFLTGMPQRFEVSDHPPVFEALLVHLDAGTGRVRKVRRLREGLD